MKLSECRKMLYFPKSLYMESLRVARERKKSLSALMRDALRDYLDKPKSDDFKKALHDAFGIWKDRKIDSYTYVRRLREGWGKRERRFR